MSFLYIRHNYSCTNKKGREFQIWFQQFDHTMFPNPVSIDGFFAEMQQKAAKLDEKYPRSAKLYVPHLQNTSTIEVYHIAPEGYPEKIIVEFIIRRVSLIYGFIEIPKPEVLPEKGGAR